MSMTDEILYAELESIQVEADRRRKARPMEPYATWKMLEQLEAINRFNDRENQRETVGASIPVAMDNDSKCSSLMR